MFGKRKLELLAHTARIKNLKKSFAPVNSMIGSATAIISAAEPGGGDETTIYHYICKRCKKRMQSIQPYLGSDSDGR